MKRGKRTEEYFAVARPSGRISERRTDLVGPFSTLEEAQYYRDNSLGGHVVRVTKTETWEPVENSSLNIRFISEDGRSMFEVRIIDNKTIEIRGVDNCIVDNVLYTPYLCIEPKSSNVIQIQPKLHYL